MTDQELLRRIERSAGQTAGYKQLIRELGLGGGRERRLLLEQLDRLTARGALLAAGRGQWTLPHAGPRENLFAGRLDVHAEGYGFVRQEHGGVRGEDDIFIPVSGMNGAMQGDQVLVELAPPRPDGRRSGRIARVLWRRNATVVGYFYAARDEHARGHTVQPADIRITQPILIPFDLAAPPPESPMTPHRVFSETPKRGAGEGDGPRPAPETRNPDDRDLDRDERRDIGRDLNGLVVEVEILHWPTPARPAQGRVIAVLGARDDFGVDVEIVIRKHHLPHQFPADVLEQARAVARLDPDALAARRDFRSLSIVTIDGETAKDFDDAVLARKIGPESEGWAAGAAWELQVHIADVSEYVVAGSPLDLEARLRGTSVYFPDAYDDMLPQELSTDLCSLRPGQDRLALSCLMQIGPEGEILRSEVCEGVIRSARRLTYAEVHAVLSGEESARERFAALAPELEGMDELARRLNRKRQLRGSIDFDLPEPVIEFDAQGAMRGIVRSERTWANRLIEEFMLAANECVASWLESLGIPSLYRIHEKPEARRVIEFEETAAGFGYSLGLGPLPVQVVTMKSERRERKGRASAGGGKPLRRHEIPQDIPINPQMYQRLALKLAGKPEERILTHLMLRSLRQARYSEKNEGHFALAAPCYTHFTSPIRRYPDLIVHRIAKQLLRRGVSGVRESGEQAHTPIDEPPIDAADLAEIADESSQAERRAEEAERELIEWKQVKFMQDRIGEDFPALVLSVTRYGLFIELDELFVEGLVPISSLQGDLFTFRENTRQIAGERSGRRYSIGDRVRVVLDRADALELRLQFSLLEEHAPPGRRGKTKTGKPGKKAAPAGFPSPSPKAKSLTRKRGKLRGGRRRGKGR